MFCDIKIPPKKALLADIISPISEITSERERRGTFSFEIRLALEKERVKYWGR